MYSTPPPSVPPLFYESVVTDRTGKKRLGMAVSFQSLTPEEQLQKAMAKQLFLLEQMAEYASCPRCSTGIMECLCTREEVINFMDSLETKISSQSNTNE